MDERQAASCPVRGEVPELFFCADLRGYGWCVRKRDALNVGFGRLDRSALSSRVREFVSLPARARKGTGRPATAVQGPCLSRVPVGATEARATTAPC